MNKRKLITLLIGILCAVALAVGFCMLFVSGKISLVGGSVVICISLASGLIVPNPLSFIGLIAGILMLILPSWVVGVILLCMGTAAALVNLFVWLESQNRAVA